MSCGRRLYDLQPQFLWGTADRLVSGLSVKGRLIFVGLRFVPLAHNQLPSPGDPRSVGLSATLPHYLGQGPGSNHDSHCISSWCLVCYVHIAVGKEIERGGILPVCKSRSREVNARAIMAKRQQMHILTVFVSLYFYSSKWPGGWGGGGGGEGCWTPTDNQLLGSANAETTPAGAPAATAHRTQRPDATCEGKNG